MIEKLKPLNVMKLTFYSTPGHGYLRVPKSTFVKCGGDPNKISGFSGQDLTTLYLEEDCDAGYFLELLESKGIEFKIESKYVNSVSNTHNYEPKLFGCRLIDGERIVLYDDSVGTIKNVGSQILVEVGYMRYRLPKSNPYKYVKAVL
jgi:hypothetical protein